MALGTEGHVNANFTQFASAPTITFSTSGTDRICLLQVNYEQSSGASSTISISSITSTSGLVWAPRKSFTHNLTFGQTNIDTFWAYAPAQLTNEVATIHFAKTGTNYADGSSASIRSISGCTNFTDPFDTNGSLAATGINPGPGNNLPFLTGISTDNANCVVFGMTTTDGTGNNPSGLAADSGWTLTDNLYNPNPSNWIYAIVEEKIFSSQLASATVQFGGTSAGGFLNNWIMMVDAITDAGVGAGATPSPAALLAGF